MFRFMLAMVAFLGYCYYSFTTVEQSDGARYRAEIGQLQEQVATLTQERDGAIAKLDTIKEKSDEIEAKAGADGQTADGETKVAPVSQLEEN